MSQATSRRVLLVDDERGILDGLRRQYRKRFDLTAACGAEEGLEALTDGEPFAVVVSDYQMPGMNGAEFLSRCRELQPAASRVMLTGQADLTTAIDAVNRGHIFRFLTKPCEESLFTQVLEDGIEQHRLIESERLLLEQTLRGAVAVFADVLALTNPAAFGRATRIQRIVNHVARTLGLPDLWQYETAALLSQLGCVAVPQDIFERLNRGERINDDERAMVDNHAELARRLLCKIPRLERVAEMVYHQGTDNPPPSNSDPQVYLGSRILAAALDFEELVGVGASPAKALEALASDGRKYDARVIRALQGAGRSDSRTSVARISVRQLQPGMVLDEDLRSKESDLLLAPRGHSLTPSTLARLKNYAALGKLQSSEVRVRIGADGQGGLAA